MEQDEEKDFLESEFPHMTESDKIKLRLKKFCLVIGILLILWIISLIIIIYYNNKEETSQDKDKENNQDNKNYNWDKNYKKAEEIISNLSLSERIGLLYGTQNMKFMIPKLLKNETEKQYLCEGQIDPFKNDKVDFKGMCLQNGPSGIRFANGTGISWQAPINTAATFNKKLMYKIGKAQGEEAKEKGINTLLSPCVNIMRTPQAGRVWESFGEDPFYSGVCASKIVEGIQKSGVIATVKHFVGYSQETYKHSSSSNIDKNALMDIYVEPFYRAIHDAKVGSVMAAYNALNNTYCTENKFLLTDILRGILNFTGFVMSDWWGVYSNHSDSFNSGLDLNMPGGYAPGPFEEEHMYDNYGRNHSFWSPLEEYVKNKKVDEKRVNESARRIIATMYKMGQIKDFPKVNLYQETKNTKRIDLQKEAATESQVLLKNDGILPFNKDINKIFVFVNDAMESDVGIKKELEYTNKANIVVNENIPLGYRSETTKFEYFTTPLQEIQKLANQKKINVISSGNLIYKNNIKGKNRTNVISIKDIRNSLQFLEKTDKKNVVIVFLNATSSGEYSDEENTIEDRLDLNLSLGYNKLIEVILEKNKNVIVVINAPSVVSLPWLEKVRAVLFSGFPGAGAGYAIANILFGNKNPSGHLPYTWANIDQYCTNISFLENLTVINKEKGKTWKDEYRYNGIDSAGLKDDRENHCMEQYNYSEGLYVGQRWFKKYNKTFIFPFGHGLSYSTFEYSDLKLSINKTGLTAIFKIKNTSERSGKIVPMMFLSFPDSIGDYPKHIFKGFEKVEIKKFETEEVTIFADDHALSYFNVTQNKYVRVNDGKIKVFIAENANISAIKLNGEIDAKY